MPLQPHKPKPHKPNQSSESGESKKDQEQSGTYKLRESWKQEAGRNPRPLVWEQRRYRNRHGRGTRQPMYGLHLPSYATKAGVFDSLVAAQLKRLSRGWPDLIESTECAVEDVPPSDPLPWEEKIIQFSASFPASHGQKARIVLYRLPLQSAASSLFQLEYLIHDELVRQLAEINGWDPQDIDPYPLI